MMKSLTNTGFWDSWSKLNTGMRLELHFILWHNNNKIISGVSEVDFVVDLFIYFKIEFVSFAE
jgi:hypothetical protein